MTTFQIGLENDQLTPFLARAPDKIRWAADRAVQRVAMEVALQMKSGAPKASSFLTASVKSEQEALMLWRVGPHVNYAAHVESGSRAVGFPRSRKVMQALTDWVKAKGLVAKDIVSASGKRRRRKTTAIDRDARNIAWAIARKQAASGIPAQPFVKPIYDSGFVQQRLLQEVPAAVRSALGGSA